MNQLEPPYPLIRDSLKQGKVIPFLGSGASLGERDPRLNAWSKGQEKHLPTASELARHLADQTTFPEDESRDLAKVAQYFGVVGGRGSLEDELRSIFNANYPFTPLHDYLASVPSPQLIVTTNYDDLIERAFAAKGRSYDLVIHTTDIAIGDQILWWKHGEAAPRKINPNKLDIDLSSVTVIYKMHGGVDRHLQSRDQYVITEDDYIDFLSRITKNRAIPAIFAEPFQTRHFLFLGYGLNEWNLRVVLNRIEKILRRRKNIKSWAIQFNPKPIEQRFWLDRGVEVYSQKVEEFIERLKQR